MNINSSYLRTAITASLLLVSFGVITSYPLYAAANGSNVRQKIIFISQLLAATTKLSYESHVLAIDNPGGVKRKAEYDIKAKLMKPDNANIEISDKDGLMAHIVINKGVGYIFSPRDNKYVRITLVSRDHNYDIATYLTPMLPTTASRVVGFADSYLVNAPLDLITKGIPTNKQEILDQTIKGKSVYGLCQAQVSSDGITNAHTTYTEKSELSLVRITDTTIEHGTSQIDYQEDFNKFNLDDDTIQDKDFDTALPTDVTVYEPTEVTFNKQPLSAGSVAPFFAVTDRNGKRMDLYDLIGKPVVIYFWTAAGENLIATLPDIMKLSKEARFKNVVFLAIGFKSDKTAIAKFTKQMPNANVKFCFDDGDFEQYSSIAQTLYRIDGLPAIYVIHKNGTIAGSYPGYFSEASETDLRIQIELALAQ